MSFLYKTIACFVPTIALFMLLKYTSDLIISFGGIILCYNIIIVGYTFFRKLKWEKNLKSEIINIKNKFNSGLKIFVIWFVICFNLFFIIFYLRLFVHIKVVQLKIPYIISRNILLFYTSLLFVIFVIYIPFIHEIYYNIFLNENSFILGFLSSINYGIIYLILLYNSLPENFYFCLYLSLFFSIKELIINMIYKYSIIKNIMLKTSLNLSLFLFFLFIYIKIFKIEFDISISYSNSNIWNYYNYY